MTDARRIIAVAGDVTVDWNLARAHKSEGGASPWFMGDRTCSSAQAGGAALLASILACLTGDGAEPGLAEWRTVRPVGPEPPYCRTDARAHQAYALWSLHRRGPGAPAHAPTAWRVESFLGLDAARPTEDMPDAPATFGHVDGAEGAAILVLDDADLGFRHRSAAWPPGPAVGGTAPEWVVLKISRPVASGPLWKHLVDHHAHRLVVVMGINDLRLTNVQVSRALSWERTAQDLAWELVHNPNVNALARCAHVIVSLGTAGAFLMSKASSVGGAGSDETGVCPEPARCFGLLFDPPEIEGGWRDARPGGTLGYTSCLAAAVCRQLMLDSKGPDIAAGVIRGLAAQRVLHEAGYGHRIPGAGGDYAFPSVEAGRSNVPGHVELVFPLNEVVSAIRGTEPTPFVSCPVQDPTRKDDAGAIVRADLGTRLWTVLQERHPGRLFPLARAVVIEGPAKVLTDVPLGRIGALLTVDRREVESFRGLRSLVAEYIHQDAGAPPLSIAVFGAPGAGKSFAVSESARALLGDRMTRLVFNLSQFDDATQLRSAFHRVRDTVLAGKIPLVFWDEFDTKLGTQPLGWLRHFLAPMQDGVFLEGETLHPIGRSIFVFAGGTKATMAGFKAEDEELFRSVKGPDFVSRLKGYIDIVGPDPTPNTSDDPHFVLRRAILLRSMLERGARHLFRDGTGGGRLNIDDGVLRAFLEVPRYRHGARSMESILAMCLLHGHARFERSCLPSQAQLDVHVDGAAFLACMRYEVFDDDLVEALARAHHEQYRGMTYPPGLPRSKWMDHDYADLPEDIQEDNRQAVRDIPSKLAVAGYIVTRLRPGAAAATFPGHALEILAENEHDRWMREKIAAGWSYGDPRDDKKRRHPLIVPWEARSRDALLEKFTEKEVDAMGPGPLPCDAKAIDRWLVQAIPDILWSQGYTVEEVGAS